MSDNEGQDLAGFLLARIYDDERLALEAAHASGHRAWTADLLAHMPAEEAAAEYVARFDPARVLAECESKRRIVEKCQSGLAEEHDMPYGGAAWLAEESLQLLALPYASHPDYREEWRP